MNMNKASGPAFPRPLGTDGYGNVAPDQDGMTLLEYYAGKALPAILSMSPNTIAEMYPEAYDRAKNTVSISKATWVAAERMIEERDRRYKD